MTYRLDRKSPVAGSAPRLLRALDRAAPCFTRPAVRRWAVTQTLELTRQLDSGTRFLDMHVAQAPGGSDRNLRFVHGVYTTALVEDTLTEVSEWLELHPREAVVVALRGFEGLTWQLHDYLAGCVRDIFAGALCPRGAIPTLRQLWSRQQQVLVSYEEADTVERHAWLWPAIPHWSRGRAGSRGLLGYLESMKDCGRPDGLFVADLHLTPTPVHMITRPTSSPDKTWHCALPALTAWVRQQHPGPELRCTNVIAGDFAGAGTFAADIIALNWKLL
ncbi:hypothetical protein STEG23_015066 [Scotinomys teguina]